MGRCKQQGAEEVCQLRLKTGESGGNYITLKLIYMAI